ncbi:MAG: glycosyltransferase family 4 protein [Bacteroidia bacterium]
MKKLLIISYYWSPAGGPGVQRWVKLSKYLSKMGYHCYVVTVDELQASYPVIDLSLQKDIDATIKVTKTKSFEALKLFSSLFKKEKVPYAGIPDKNKMTLVGRFALYIRSNFFIPDARVGWNSYAIKACEQLIEQEHIDAIITTSPPHSTQLVGLSLKKKYKHIKWIADLRDPWTDIYYYSNLSHTQSSKQKDLRLEKQVLEQADCAVTVSEDLKTMFLKKSNKLTPDKITVLPNGYDEDDFTAINLLPNNLFTIAHTGTINSNYNVGGFVKALTIFLQTHANITINFIGNVDVHIKQQLQAANFKSYMPHEEVIKQMCQADLLLLAIPDNSQNKGILTGKLFEYLASQKPILCIGPTNGDAAAIIQSCHAGKVFEFIDEQGILAYLQEIYALWQQNKTTQLCADGYKKYSRKALAAQYAQVIEGC